MDIVIDGEGAFGSALVKLGPGDRFISESGAMYRASSNVDIDVTTRTKQSGGLLSGLKRLFAGESFFLSSYSLMHGETGEVGLAPILQGEVGRLDVAGPTGWVCTGGSFMGAGPDIDLETRFQGLKGFLTGEGLFFVEARGDGPMLVSAFGQIHEEVCDGELVVDTGHVVAFEDTLQYELDRVGGSWFQSFLGGEGFVLRFSGRGRVVLQSHNPKDFGTFLGRLLPPRQA